MICAVCLITAAAFPATAVYGNGGSDIMKYAGEAIDYSVSAAGANDVQDYIDGYLSDNAGLLSEWTVITLARTDAGYDFSSYVASLNKYVKNNKVESASKRLLYSLAFLCCGDYGNGYIASSVNDSIGELGIMSYIYGLHMLNNGYVSDKFTASGVIEQLLSLRLGDGGWALFGTVSDIDVSAMTVQALAPYYKNNVKVKKAVDEAMSLLSSRQLDDGSYKGFGKENCESTAQVAIAMASLGMDRKNDKRFIKNGKNIIDGIIKFRLEDGSFCHVIDGGYNMMATVQALMAFVAFDRAENGKSAFYSVRKNALPVITETEVTPTSASESTAGAVVSSSESTRDTAAPTVAKTTRPTEKH
ncbi:MAG: terpene cyclase/mutase family protein, partial [Clostridia bacterium]|nr:terpene cyclase/mutase family protein [Clostridia bacterium]